MGSVKAAPPTVIKRILMVCWQGLNRERVFRINSPHLEARFQKISKCIATEHWQIASPKRRLDSDFPTWRPQH
jgi:hypothetical protein